MIASQYTVSREFPADIYRRIALNDLVTYAVYFLSQNGGEINALRDIVAACFKLFPEEIFSLRWVTLNGPIQPMRKQTMVRLSRQGFSAR